MLSLRISPLLLLGVCALTACKTSTSGVAEKRVDMLSPAQKQTAAQVANAGIRQRAMIPAEDPRVYLVDIQEIRDKQDGDEATAPRRALVTHYRYRDDTALLTTVDLEAKTVENVQTLSHVATPLAPEEVEAALALAKADPRAAEIMSRPGVVTEHLLLSTSATDDPLYGNRVVRLLFRVGRDYVRAPIVLVNLSRRSVALEEPPAPPVGDQH